MDPAAAAAAVAAAAASENTGRWTHEEHERFLQGLEMYGKKWTKVAEVVRTRTTVQVRSHAQKYFQKQSKGRLDGEPMPGTGAGLRGAGFDDLRRPVAVPPPLRPFVPEGSRDIAIGLYSYLSPHNIPSHVSGGGEGHPDPHLTIPQWYREGHRMESLLDQAEQLDWVADSGSHPPVGPSAPPLTSTGSHSRSNGDAAPPTRQQSSNGRRAAAAVQPWRSGLHPDLPHPGNFDFPPGDIDFEDDGLFAEAGGVVESGRPGVSPAISPGAYPIELAAPPLDVDASMFDVLLNDEDLLPGTQEISFDDPTSGSKPRVPAH